MRVLLEWKCGYCNSVQVSDSYKRWSMDGCKCGKSALDLEDGYQRSLGEIIEINRVNLDSSDRLDEVRLSDFERMLRNLNKR